MSNVAFVTSQNTIFFGCTPDQAIEGSPDTFVNGLQVHRKQDLWSVHVCNHGNSYDAYLQEGAPTHFTNSLNTGRVGDPVLRYRQVAGTQPYRTGTAFVSTGSPDTFIGGNAGGGVGDPFFRAGSARAGQKLYTIFGS
jgi:uncharacterized Zn-binding protein involved in type VI secretion